MFFRFLDRNSSASTLAYLEGGEIKTIFSNKGHIDENMVIQDLTGDGIPDLVNTSFQIFLEE